MTRLPEPCPPSRSFRRTGGGQVRDEGLVKTMSRRQKSVPVTRHVSRVTDL
jgi:hypothetical protein